MVIGSRGSRRFSPRRLVGAISAFAIVAVSLALVSTPKSAVAAATAYVGPFYGTITETFETYEETYWNSPDGSQWEGRVQIRQWKVTHTVAKGSVADEDGGYDATSSFNYWHSDTSDWFNGVQSCIAWTDESSSGSSHPDYVPVWDTRTNGNVKFGYGAVNDASVDRSTGASHPDCGPTSTEHAEGFVFGQIDVWPFDVAGVPSNGVVKFEGTDALHDGFVEGQPDTSGYHKYSADVTVDVDMRCELPCDGATSIDFDWKMVDQTVDADHDGLIDAYMGGNRTADVPADGRYPVRLTACGQSASNFAWFLSGPQGQTRSVTPGRCAATVRLEEGRWQVVLAATRGGMPASGAGELQVRNHLIVSLGDSFASGEGNPDATIHRVRRPDKVVWKDRDCHRSAWAAPARSALVLEEASEQTSVTFIHLACSGGTIPNGLFGRYKGAEKDGHGNAPQLSEARKLVNGQPVDSLVLSIGGNDVGFGPTILFCLISNNCWKNRVNIEGVSGNLHDVSQTLLKRLGGRYVALANCFSVGQRCSLGSKTVASPLKVAPDRIVQVGYPDLTKGQSGVYCDDAGAMRADEYEWADKVLLSGVAGGTATLTEKGNKQLATPYNGLNVQIDAMEVNGWNAVTSVYEAFLGHGYCADEESWIRSIPQSFKMQHNEKGGFHPNRAGHAAITVEMLPSLIGVLGGV